ncbi:hypothetical protein RDWZM_002916, partial [Blomia tropicalis]
RYCAFIAPIDQSLVRSTTIAINRRTQCRLGQLSFGTSRENKIDIVSLVCDDDHITYKH